MLHTYTYGNPNTEGAIPIVFLHGFLGSGKVFLPALESKEHSIYAILPDLPGHGLSQGSGFKADYRPPNLVDKLFHWFDELEIDQVYLHGYSMGGRLATEFTLQFPDKIKGIILESNVGGGAFINHQTREKRLLEDTLRATQISKNYPQFLSNWQKQSLFVDRFNPKPIEYLDEHQQKALWQNNHIQQRQNPLMMAAFIQGFSPARQHIDAYQLNKLNKDVLLICGRNDTTYTDKMSQLDKHLGHQSTLNIIDDAWHRVHIDQPVKWLDTILGFVQQD